MKKNQLNTENRNPTETTALIFNPVKNTNDITDLSTLTFKDYAKEVLDIYISSIPVFLGNVAGQFVSYISVFFIGQYLGKYELAAASLSNMFATITGWSLSASVTNVLNTFCSQAFTGSSDITLVGVYLQRGILITLTLFTPIGLVWWNTELILLSLNVDAQLAEMCGNFLKVLLLGAFPYIAFDCLIKFLLAQGITKAQSYITFLVLPIHIAFNYLLIVNPSTRVGFIGAPLATVLTYWLMFTLGLIYILFIDGYQAWGGWSKKCLKEWMPFIKMSIASVIMTCSEWWAFEILALGASYLGVLELASYSVVMSIGSLTWHVCFAVSLIASIRAGNLIGEGIVNKAIFTIRSSFITSFLCSCGNVTTVLLLHRQLASIFSSDPEVIDMASALLPVAASYQVFDGLSTVASGVLRGQGKHHTGAVINAIGYYMISIPLGFYLAFNCNMGLRGLYAGILVTLIITSACLIYSVLNSDWDEIIRSCRLRLNSENQSDL